MAELNTATGKPANGFLKTHWRVGASILIFLAALWLAWPVYSDAIPRQFPDTSAYIRWPAGDLPINGFRAVGPRPPVFPLLLKLTGCGPALSYVQTVLSVACWCFFGWALAGTIGVVFGGLMANVPVIWLWNQVALSESVSFSMLAAIVGAVILLARKRTRLRLITAVCFLVVFAFTRDSNIFLIPLIALPVIVKGPRSSLVFACIAAAVVIAGFVCIRLNDRWQWGHNNVIAARILTDPDAIAFYSAAGMPTDDAVLRQAGKLNNISALVSLSRTCPEFYDWIEKKGVHTYMRWLLPRGKSYVEPWRFFQKIVDYEAWDYAKTNTAKKDVFGLAAGFYRLVPSPTFCTLFLVVATIGCFIRGQVRFLAVVSLSLLVGVYTQAFIIYHGDGAEVDRHMIPALLLYRMAIITTFFLLVHMGWEFLKSQHDPTRPAPAHRRDGRPSSPEQARESLEHHSYQQSNVMSAYG